MFQNNVGYNNLPDDFFTCKLFIRLLWSHGRLRIYDLSYLVPPGPLQLYKYLVPEGQNDLEYVKKENGPRRAEQNFGFLFTQATPYSK